MAKNERVIPSIVCIALIITITGIQMYEMFMFDHAFVQDMNNTIDCAGLVFIKINNFMRFATLAGMVFGCQYGMSYRALLVGVISIVVNICAQGYFLNYFIDKDEDLWRMWVQIVSLVGHTLVVGYCATVPRPDTDLSKVSNFKPGKSFDAKNSDSDE